MSNLSDVVGGANLFGGSSYLFTYDRFCSPNSAIYFNRGYLQVPAGVYFSGDLTVTAWIYLKSYQSWSRTFDFGNGSPSDNVYLAMIGKSSQIAGYISKGTSSKSIQTSSIINLNKWYFISFVLSGTTGKIYVNGSQAVNDTLNVPKNISRTRNYIGKSNWPWDSDADAICDEFKIFEGALSSSDIMNEYQISSNNGKINKNHLIISIFYNIYIKGNINDSCLTTITTTTTTAQTTTTTTTTTTKPTSTILTTSTISLETATFLATIGTSLTVSSSSSTNAFSTSLTIPNNLTSISNISQSLLALSITIYY
jgi:hypothetical protein